MNSRPPSEAHRKDLDKVLRVLQDIPAIDREYMAPLEEFQARVRRTNQSLQHHGHTVGLVFSDEQYAGDVPYLGGIQIFPSSRWPASAVAYYRAMADKDLTGMARYLHLMFNSSRRWKN